jgi:hypothetical protein
MSPQDAIDALEGGYCLWVGAGLSVQLAARKARVPMWAELVDELETMASLKVKDGGDMPARLEVCLEAVGEAAFRSFLRRRYYTELSTAILQLASEALCTNDPLPKHLKSLAALGQLANPIVSFNIEPLSTVMLSRPAGPVRVVFQQSASSPAVTWREPSGSYARLAYHPHGLATADSVMTASQYARNEQSLAFQLAVHAAFANDLAIVGMSLDDEHLRKQITQYRSGIKAIYWFNSSFTHADLNWAQAAGIRLVEAPWPSFWDLWSRVPVACSDDQLLRAWHFVVDEATTELEGGALGSLHRSLLRSRGAKSAPAQLESIAKKLAQRGMAAGEPGVATAVEGQSPRSIELRLRDRVHKAGLSTLSITKQF